MRFLTMQPDVQSKPFDTGAELYPIYSSTSSSSYPPRSPCGRHNLSRHVKVASESFADDFFQRSPRFPSPDEIDTEKYAIQEDVVSSQDSDSGLPPSTRSVIDHRYLVLAAKDRLKSASLEWTLSNGSVIPKLPHYHTHPALDFKGLKKKLEELTGSPDDANKKFFPGVSSHDRRKGAVAALPPTTTGSNPAGGYSCVDAVNQTDISKLFQNVPYVATERLSNTTSKEVQSKPAKPSETSINEAVNELSCESSVKFQWIDVVQRVAEKDERLQKLLKRHCQELEDLKKKHELQWVELRQRTSESVSEDLPQNNVPTQSDQLNRSCHEVALGTPSACTDSACAVPETRFQFPTDSPAARRELALELAGPKCSGYAKQEGIDQWPLSTPDVDMILCTPGVANVKQTIGDSLGNSAVATQSDVRRVDEVNGENMRRDFLGGVEGARNLSEVYGGGNQKNPGVPQHLPSQVRSQLTSQSMTMGQQQTENQASSPLEQHICRPVVERTPLKNPLVQQQVEPHNWRQLLEVLQHVQAAAPLEHWLKQQPVLQQGFLLEATAEAYTQSEKVCSQLLPNRHCHCAGPCDLAQSFLPHFHEHPYSADPFSALNFTGHVGIGHAPNYAQVPPFPQPSAIYQSPCNEVSSYYYPESLAYSSSRGAKCNSPDPLACLLEAARNTLLPVSPVLFMSPSPMPLLSHLVARQSPLSFDLAHPSSHPSSLRSSPALPLLYPQQVFQVTPIQTTPSEIRQFFYPLQPYAN